MADSSIMKICCAGFWLIEDRKQKEVLGFMIGILGTYNAVGKL